MTSAHVFDASACSRHHWMRLVSYSVGATIDGLQRFVGTLIDTCTVSRIGVLDVAVGRIAGCTLPIVYIWSLPLLAHVGFAHSCEGFPGCEHVGVSVSNFISNTHATGAIASCLFYPCMLCWMNAHLLGNQPCVCPTLVLFQLCFGMFLTCPIVEVPRLHAFAVMLFCIAGFSHYCMVLRYCQKGRLWLCTALLSFSVVAFGIMIILVIISFIDEDFLPRRIPWVFYFSEAFGLSCMSMFPALWCMESDAVLPVSMRGRAIDAPNRDVQQISESQPYVSATFEIAEASVA
eukprot:TRINITY_DN50664_c0_g1_i1.p1 TRINITY_DN50664_c0_g1~~TRINITY_DN50664_c0_g1_i1.p1  ORF type:complete len:290 (+),score=26.14 TRINITY_DN50664_c0_g1_i1:52-921(+)